mmetsp:Transcript_4048/g.3382  ORF Transcript_4048/g.3382 Transcript_4048/m.3382 type:complete len:89 (+) Transcript_4048:157-423(+)
MVINTIPKVEIKIKERKIKISEGDHTGKTENWEKDRHKSIDFPNKFLKIDQPLLDNKHRNIPECLDTGRSQESSIVMQSIFDSNENLK